MRSLIAALPLSLLGACATVPAEGDPPSRVVGDGQCSNEQARIFIGQRATAELGGRMLAATGAATLRWVPPRTAVTMDFRADRLTVGYDDNYIITSASCT